MTYLSWLLMWFDATSGLKVNFAKSEIIPVERVDNVEALALEIGCKIGVLPSFYLSLSLGAHHNSVTIWDNIEERFQKKLALWKRQYISKGGRLTLLRSTLSRLPICHMSLFRLPRRVKLRLEHIQRYFLWGEGSLDKKPHLVKWATIFYAKKEGGLGVRGLYNLNKALLSKWLRCFANERDSLWRKVISSKFGEDLGVVFMQGARKLLFKSLERN